MNKSKNVGWARHVVRTDEKINEYKNLKRKTKENRRVRKTRL
jgi:hypothetical protein